MKRLAFILFLMPSLLFSQQGDFEAINLNKKWYTHDGGKQMNPHYSFQFFLGTPILWNADDWERYNGLIGFGHPNIHRQITLDKAHIISSITIFYLREMAQLKLIKYIYTLNTVILL